MCYGLELNKKSRNRSDQLEDYKRRRSSIRKRNVVLHSLQFLFLFPSHALHEHLLPSAKNALSRAPSRQDHPLPPVATTEMGFNRLTLAAFAACTIMATLVSLAAVTEASVLPAEAPSASDFINGIDSDGIDSVTITDRAAAVCAGKPPISPDFTCEECGATTIYVCHCTGTQEHGFFSILHYDDLWYKCEEIHFVPGAGPCPCGATTTPAASTPAAITPAASTPGVPPTAAPTTAAPTTTAAQTTQVPTTSAPGTTAAAPTTAAATTT